jgi:hypothetical protein
MITVTLYCGQCPNSKEVQMDGDKLESTPEQMIRKAATEKTKWDNSKWVVQNNGGYIDTYCSKRCADL